MKRGIIPITIVLCIACAPSLAQNAETASEVFAKAVRLYSTGAYDSVIVTIRGFLKNHGKDPAAESLVPLAMEAFIRIENYSPVKRLFDLYTKKYRSSPFMPRVYYLHGVARAKERSFRAAFESFSRALEAGLSDDLDSLLITSVETLCANVLDGGDLRSMGGNDAMHPRIREIARYYEITTLIKVGDRGKAGKRTSEFRESFPHSRFSLPATDDDAPVSTEGPKGEFAIGLLAPLSGDEADAGKRVSQGVRLAIASYNARHPLQIGITAYDTRGSLVETVRKTQTLLERDRVPLIIGPVLSSTATVAAALLLGKDAVMISPTATDDGIAELGPNVFQMNVTVGVLARKLARYAIDNLSIREFAIVTPRTAYGAAMASIFRDEVTKSQGSIFDEQYFEEGGNDFTTQFVALRRKLLLRRLDQNAKAAGLRPVTRVSAGDSSKWADSIMSIGAIFMPAESDDAVMLAPQVSFNKIKAQLLGSGGWYSRKTLTDGKHYVQNAVISAQFEPDSSWKKWMAFKKEYIARYREEPDRAAALGFDAVGIVITAVENAGGAKARLVAEALCAVQKFEGASGFISFGRDNRVNTEAIILKCVPNGFVRVQ